MGTALGSKFERETKKYYCISIKRKCVMDEAFKCGRFI